MHGFATMSRPTKARLERYSTSRLEAQDDVEPQNISILSKANYDSLRVVWFVILVNIEWYSTRREPWVLPVVFEVGLFACV